MREIKFRGKRIDNGEWVYGNLIYSSDACKEYETLIIPQRDADGFTTDYTSNGENKESYGFDNWFCVIPETVGQYTGFKDKNGKEIYDGDIVKVTDDNDEISELNSDTGIGAIEWLDKWGFWSVSKIENGLVDLIYCYDVEVIENIHDNPELLEVL